MATGTFGRFGEPDGFSTAPSRATPGPASTTGCVAVCRMSSAVHVVWEVPGHGTPAAMIILVSVPMSIAGALFISVGIGGASLNIYTDALDGVDRKHGILIVEFADGLQRAGRRVQARGDRASLRNPAAANPDDDRRDGAGRGLIIASGAGAVSFNMGLVASQSGRCSRCSSCPRLPAYRRGPFQACRSARGGGAA